MIVELDQVRCWDFGALPLDVYHSPYGWTSVGHRERFNAVMDWFNGLLGSEDWQDCIPPGTAVHVDESPVVTFAFPGGTTDMLCASRPFPVAAWLHRMAA